MVKVICKVCNKENKYLSESDVRSECEYCYSFFEHPFAIVQCDEPSPEPESLTIIYQITQERIQITTDQKVVLGRENVGRETFSKILHNGKPTISRKHCSIEFKDGRFMLSDEGSLNGTFAGVNKEDCKKSPRVIEHDSIFYLGEEPFLAKMNIKNKAKEKEEKKPAEEITRKIKYYQCNDQNCSGYTSEVIFDSCPECNSFKNIKIIYE